METATLETLETIEGGEPATSTGSEKAWLTSVPETLRGHEVFKSIEKPAEVYQRLIDLTEKSKDMVVIPKENATPEELTAYRQALGIPETSEGYEIKRPEKMPEGLPYDEVLESKFKETAHNLGLTSKQVQGLYEMFNSYGIEGYTQLTKLIADNKNKAVNTLKDIWKNDYETNKTKTVRTFFETLGKFNPPANLGKVEDIAKEFDQSGFGDNPVIVWYFSKLYDLIGNDTFIKGNTGSGGAEDPSKPKVFSSYENMK